MLVTILITFIGFKLIAAITEATFSGTYYRDR